MGDLISRQGLLECLQGRSSDGWIGIPALRNLIESQNTIDALPVVRCHDCKYWWKENETCIKDENCDGLFTCVIAADKDHFCGYGERKKK